MLHIIFEYRDKFSRGKWNRQECVVRSVKDCIEIYGLGVDCDFRIIEIRKENEDGKQT